MKLSLTAKVLIFVGLSLLIEVAFVGAVAYLQTEAERDAQIAIRAQKLSDCINRLSKDLYDVWNFVGAANKSAWVRPGYMQDLYDNTMTKIQEDYKQLDLLTLNQSDLNGSVQQSRERVNQADQVIREALRSIALRDIDAVMRIKREKFPQLRMLFKGAITEELELAAVHERKISDLSQEKQAAIRQQLLTLSLTALILNVAISMILAAFLVSKITSRLLLMGENIERFANGQSLHSPISGSDEIAVLDNSFHDMTQRLAEVEEHRQQLISMVTHDMRSPLMVIQGSLEVLTRLDPEDLEERVSNLAPLVVKNCSRVVALINDLLDIEKINSGMVSLNPSKFFVNEVFEEVSENLEGWLTEQKLRIVIVDGEAYVDADKDLISRVLFNLVTNAVRYSPENGVITLAAEERDGAVEIRVADQGSGISEEEFESIFDRFKQAKSGRRDKNNSGLGLAICKSIVHLHGGRIWVESELNRGTVFYFTIPTQHTS